MSTSPKPSGRPPKGSGTPTPRPPQRRGRDLDRPLPTGAPPDLVRGTAKYREWEIARVQELRAIGLSRAQICQQLDLTPREYQERRERQKTDAEPLDPRLILQDFLAATDRAKLDAERLITMAIEKGNVNGGVGAVRLRLEIGLAVFDRLLACGVMPKLMPGGEAAQGEAAGALPAALTTNNFLVQILNQGSGGEDLLQMTDPQVMARLKKVLAERAALADPIEIPSLVKGRS